VKSVLLGIDNTITDASGLRAQIEPIQRAIRDFHSLDEDLKGQAGSAIRAFYQDTHELFLIFLHQSLTDYENLLNEMKDAISTYEPNESGYVSQAYLENDVIEGFEKVKNQVTELTNDANSIIGDIDDLVTIPEVDESLVMDDVQAGEKKAKDIVEELNILDEFEASQLEQTKNDIHTMQTFLSNIESKFRSGDLSIANYDVKVLEKSQAYYDIVERIYKRNSDAITQSYGDNIDKMPMSEIEKMKDELLASLDKNSQEFLDEVYADFESGQIDRETFKLIVQEMSRSDLAEMDSDSQAYIEQIYKDFKDDEVDKDTFTTVFSGVVSTGAFFVKDMLQAKIEGEVIDAAVEGAARWVKHTTELFVNPEAVLQTVGGAEVTRTVTSKFKDQVRNLVNAGAKYGPTFIGTALDTITQIAVDGEDTKHAVLKSIGHIGTGIVGRLAGPAIVTGVGALVGVTLPAGAAVIAGLAAGTALAYGFDWAYDKWGRDMVNNVVDVGKDIVNNVGNAVSGIFGGLKSAFNF